MKRFGFLAAALGLAGFASSASAALVIDTFSSANPNGDIVLQQAALGSNTSVQSGIATTQVIGGTRDLKLTVTANSNPALFRATDVVALGPGQFSISNDTSVDSTSVLTYNAGGSGLGGIDLTAFGTGIAFDLVVIDLNATITIDLFTAANATSTLTLSNLTAGTALFSFASFSAPAVASSVNEIRVTFNTPNAADLTGSFLRVTGTAVPEPSTVAALASGAIFMGGVALRRRRAAKA